jgi:23S rRNA pseudouridine2605 synthase
MRINKYIAAATGLSRRAADKVIEEGRVLLNGAPPQPGQEVGPDDKVRLDYKLLHMPETPRTIILNKPIGYVVSRRGQGSNTIYDLLPKHLHNLKPIGRLDKDSSGLLLLTDDGQLAQELTHPKYQKTKIYEIELNKPLLPLHRETIRGKGVALEDGHSRFMLEQLAEDNDLAWRVTMQEGRNRQIRRTFAALGYKVVKLHRTQFGSYKLSPALTPGNWIG